MLEGWLYWRKFWYHWKFLNFENHIFLVFVWYQKVSIMNLWDEYNNGIDCFQWLNIHFDYSKLVTYACGCFFLLTCGSYWVELDKQQARIKARVHLCYWVWVDRYYWCLTRTLNLGNCLCEYDKEYLNLVSHVLR
jgi:hypothetical protein